MFGYYDDGTIKNISRIEDFNNHQDGNRNTTLITVSQEYAVFHKHRTANENLLLNSKCNWMSDLPKGFSCLRKTFSEECLVFYVKTECSNIVVKMSKT